MASSQLGDFQLGGAGFGDLESGSGSFPGSIALEVTVGEPGAGDWSEPDGIDVGITFLGPTVSGVVSPGSVAAEVTVAGPSVSGVSAPGSAAVEVTVGEPTTAGQSQVISTQVFADVRGPLSYSTNNAYSFLVGGADITANFDATRSPLNISRELNGRSTASFGLISVDGTYAPDVGEDVYIMWGSDPIFGGTIQEFTETTDGASGIRIFSVSATDYNAIMDRRIVYKTYQGYTAKEIMMSLVSTYLMEEGVTFVNGHGDPEVEFEEDIVFNGITVADAVSRICDLTNWDRFIDDSKGFHFFDPSAGWQAGPQSLAQGDGKIVVNSGAVRHYRGNYANVQWIRTSIALGGTFKERLTGGTFLIGPGSPTQPAAFTAVQAATKAAALAGGSPVPLLVRLETSTGSLPPLTPRPSVDGYDELKFRDYQIDTTTYAENNGQWQVQVVELPTFDSDGNFLNHAGTYIVLNEFDPDLQDAGSITGVTVESPTPEGTNQLVKAINQSQITARQAVEGGSGKWEHVEDIGDIEDREEAEALAAALLDRKDELPIVFTFQTDTSGWKPGQLVSVNLTRPLVPSGDYLVQRVTIGEYSNSLAANPPFLRSTVELVSGSAQLTPIERARRERARERPNRNTANADMTFLLAKTITGATNPGLSTGTNRPNNTQRVSQKGRLVELSAIANTPPTGASIQIDVLHQVGGQGAFESVLPGYLTISPGRGEAIMRLSDEYARNLKANDRIRLDVIQVGSDEPGKDIVVKLRILA